jgi:hypothetical protein
MLKDLEIIMKIAVSISDRLKETKRSSFWTFSFKRVSEETVTESRDCFDARTIQKNISEGKIYVSKSSSHDKGEIEALNLYRLGEFELIASDDRRFLNYLEKNNIPYLTSSSLIVYLLYKKRLSKKDTIKYIDSLKVHISKDQYLTAMSEVQRWEK